MTNLPDHDLGRDHTTHSGDIQVYNLALPDPSSAYSNGGIQFVDEMRATAQVASNLVGINLNPGGGFQNICLRYPMARRINNDSCCGWRALAYGYFELLLTTGDVENVKRERTRMTSYISFIMKMIPTYNHDIISFLSEQMNRLFSNLAEWISLEDNRSLLKTYFNDERTDIIIYATYFFKLLAAAYVRTFPEKFHPPLDAACINLYCNFIINPEFQIEEVGLQAIAKSIFRPLGFGMNVLDFGNFEAIYVNDPPQLREYTFPSDQTPLSVNLLCRIGRYDIIYRPNIRTQVQVRLARVCEGEGYCDQITCPLSIFNRRGASNVAQNQLAPLGPYSTANKATKAWEQPLTGSMYNPPGFSNGYQYVSRVPKSASNSSIRVFGARGWEKPASLTASKSPNQGPPPSINTIKAEKACPARSLSHPRTRMPRTGREKTMCSRVVTQGCTQKNQTQSRRRGRNCRKLAAHFNNPKFHPDTLDLKNSKKLYDDIMEKRKERAKALEDQGDPMIAYFTHPDFHPEVLDVGDGEKLYNELTEKRDKATKTIRCPPKKDETSLSS